MKLLLDTHVLVWAFVQPHRLSPATRNLIDDPLNEPAFSAVAIWELTIKRTLGRPDFNVDPHVLHREALDSGYQELAVTSAQAMGVQLLPYLHRDPFDRLMLAQAVAEGMIFLTADHLILQYGQPSRAV
ncbi:type II toxin-antitoxin system VapC family toxin [Phenylobacterium sp.]|uniref:type II toxin-antitoxin system VapC family toxin n=1 Tax=Phenylobacterium sp. TaxID=1871053 RepID=UPI0025FE555A|nr:type II toxin-antitoxin system VapC family toxin [Phenylobacterium sp.]MBX3482339.1 type II toxin-antitoxin system VapC family toxin [Phenylobacterium sp.]